MLLTIVVNVLFFGYERLKIRAQESRVSWCVHWWNTGASTVAKPLLVASLFAGLGLWFALSLPSHTYMAVLVVAIALACGICLRD
jgi:hypothetical protein